MADPTSDPATPDLRTAAQALLATTDFRDSERACIVCHRTQGHEAGCEAAVLIAALAAEATEPPPAAIDAAHLAHQREWSRETFGPGPRTLGVIDHIRKELVEIEADPADLGEWVDVIILSFDGAWRAGWEPQEIIDAVKGKQARNEARTWPDWRAMSEDHAIEHDRTSEQVAGSAPSPQGADEPAVIWTCPPCRRGEHGDCMDAGTGTCQCAQNDHGTAGGGVPDEPGDDPRRPDCGSREIEENDPRPGEHTCRECGAWIDA